MVDGSVIPAAPAPPGFVSSIGCQTPRTKSLTVVSFIFLIISTLALCLRLFTRIHVMRLFGVDNYKQFIISLHTDCSKLYADIVLTCIRGYNDAYFGNTFWNSELKSTKFRGYLPYNVLSVKKWAAAWEYLSANLCSDWLRLGQAHLECALSTFSHKLLKVRSSAFLNLPSYRSALLFVFTSLRLCLPYLGRGTM